MLAKGNQGRPKAIPARLIPELLQRLDRGEGYRMLSRWLKRCGIDASPAACRRAALRLPPIKILHRYKSNPSLWRSWGKIRAVRMDYTCSAERG